MEFRIIFGPREGPTARGAALGARRKIRWRGVSGAWALSGAPLSVSLSGVCLCACLLSDGGMISDEGREL